MKKKILATAITLALPITAAVAGGLPASSADAYVTTDKGDVVRDISGGCVRTNSWTPATSIPSCEGKAVARPKAKVAVIKKPSRPAKAADPEFVTMDILGGTSFDVNQATLKPRGKQQLDKMATKLKEAVTTETVQIAGHTDSTGSDRYNQGLSERRAAAVRSYLISRGVAANKINSIGFGESKPIASNASKAGRSKNRRVEVRISATKQVN